MLEKVDNPTFVPSAPENPQIDEKLVGAWDSGTGLYYYFGEDGRMYCNSYGTTFTYFTYNTKLNKVTAVYDMDGEQTDTYDYTFDGNDLVFDGMKYTQITPEKCSLQYSHIDNRIFKDRYFDDSGLFVCLLNTDFEKHQNFCQTIIKAWSTF